MKDITFREAHATDAHTVAALHALSWQNTYRGMYSDEFLDNQVVQERLEVWQKRFLQPESPQYVCLAVQAQQVVGFVCAYDKPNDPYGIFVDNLHVTPTLKGRGIGKQLLKQIALWAAQTYQNKGIYLWVLEQNTPAIQFYEKLGATTPERKMEQLQDGRQLPILRCVWHDFRQLF